LLQPGGPVERLHIRHPDLGSDIEPLSPWIGGHRLRRVGYHEEADGVTCGTSVADGGPVNAPVAGGAFRPRS